MLRSIVPSVINAKDRMAETVNTIKPLAEHVLAESVSFSKFSIPIQARVDLLLQGFHSQAYVIYDFENHHPSLYVTDYQRRRAGLINQPFSHLLNNKLLFHNLLSSFSEYRPSLYGIIKKNTFYHISDETVSIDSFDWIRSRLITGGQIVLKPITGTAGVGVVVLAFDDDFYLNGEIVPESRIRETLETDTELLVCDHVNQTAYANNLYPRSANSIRLLTMYDEHRNEAFIATAVHRIGTDESTPVDNWSSGGLSAGIELKTGELTEAVQAPDDDNLMWYDFHPDSGAKITGITVPHWDVICETVIDIAETMPYLPYIGWDIVVTDTGFVILEANSRTDVDLLQVHGPLLANKRIRNFYEYHDII